MIPPSGLAALVMPLEFELIEVRPAPEDLAGVPAGWSQVVAENDHAATVGFVDPEAQVWTGPGGVVVTPAVVERYVLAVLEHGRPLDHGQRQTIAARATPAKGWLR